MEIIFNDNVKYDDLVYQTVNNFLKIANTIEAQKESPVIIYQDGKSKGYYIKCNILAKEVIPLLDINAKLNPTDKKSYRANREILTDHNTYKRMVYDAKKGREFNDIIIEFNQEYNENKPMKIWGGQHRAMAIQEAFSEEKTSRYHGFKVFFNLSKEQRTEIALISNTNINVSNDLFDRLQEETFVGLELREWCYQVGLLKKTEDFPDQGSKSENITVKLARTFIVNFYLGQEKSEEINNKDIDKKIFEPYLCESGMNLDPKYEHITKTYSPWNDKKLKEAGISFNKLHRIQFESVKNKKGDIPNKKGFRNKALTESVISAWAFVSGLLQQDKNRLGNHYYIPKLTKKIPDPLNAQEMSTYYHLSDEPTYRGLGTRSSITERQRMTQLFLARSLKKDGIINRKLIDQAVSQVVGIKSLQKGYTV